MDTVNALDFSYLWNLELQCKTSVCKTSELKQSVQIFATEGFLEFRATYPTKYVRDVLSILAVTWSASYKYHIYILNVSNWSENFNFQLRVTILSKLTFNLWS